MQTGFCEKGLYKLVPNLVAAETSMLSSAPDPGPLVRLRVTNKRGFAKPANKLAGNCGIMKRVMTLLSSESELGLWDYDQ